MLLRFWLSFLLLPFGSNRAKNNDFACEIYKTFRENLPPCQVLA